MSVSEPVTEVLRTARLGGALIGSTMLGAMFFHVAVLDTGVGGPLVRAGLLPLVMAAGWRGRGERVEEAAAFRLR